jgi:hypothetical protein
MFIFSSFLGSPATVVAGLLFCGILKFLEVTYIMVSER